jgi:hypothetical protein
MKKTLFLFLVCGWLSASFPAFPQGASMRLPATPLVSGNPNFSIWSMTDHPGTDWPRHWTGTVQAMACFARIDGKTYRLLGSTHQEIPPMKIVNTAVLPTRTIYTFEESGIRIQLTFTNPLLPGDLVLLSEALTYVTWQMQPIDGKAHELDVYFDVSAELVVNSYDQQVAWSRPKISGLEVMQMGSSEQRILGKSGDDLRIDWGYLYVVSPSEQRVSSVICGAGDARRSFLKNSPALPDDDLRMPRAASDDWPVMVSVFSFDSLAYPVERYLMLAYDDGYRVEFLNRKLLPYWKVSGMQTSGMLKEGIKGYAGIREKCAQFDAQLMKELISAGGQAYCNIAVPAFRQSLSACGLAADLDGTPMYFPKENFSNGCISTVDVIYPACPILLYCNPELLRAQLEPLMIYASTKRWKFPFAPHDLGTYPLANGQVYGGGERTEENQMPVEESGNMLIMLYALALKDGNAAYAGKYWPVVTKWAEYLSDKGLDPENQLCTDDFAGHLAHNTNLSVKAIIALGCYARLSAMLGKTEDAKRYMNTARQFAGKWKEMAADGDHYRLAFDKPGTWSQKYNMVWDNLLGLHLFDRGIIKKEIEFYLKQQNKYGLPLDNRKDYTKLDWILWTATMTGNDETFRTMIDPVCKFLNDTPDRVPMSDWYDTKTAKQIGFQARSVVGGVFIRMLRPVSGSGK